MTHHHPLRSAVLAIAALGTGVCANAFDTEQDAQSSVAINQVEVASDSIGAINGQASSRALYPAAPTAYQARTAARSSSTEIAANSQILDTAYSFEPFDLVLSQANYAIEVPAEAFSRTADFDFFLPPSYLEVVSSAELPDNELRASMLAEVRVCFSSSCSLGDERFRFDAFLNASWREHAENYGASGDTSLDLSLLAPTLTDGDYSAFNFERTVNYAFPAFTGQIEVGRVPAGQTVRIEYVMQTRASGELIFNSAIAAINDPFELDTDAVMAGAPISSLTIAPVPEASTVMMLAAGLLALALRRRRSH